MHISICLNPKKIKNRYTGETQYVRCGKCAYCRNLKASQWVQRIEQESKCHPFAVFFTLTYSDKYAPFYSYVESLDALVHDDEIIPLSDLRSANCLDKQSMNYIYERKSLPMVSVIDIQLFIKRLRYIFKKYVPENESQKFRYFLSTEYGPTTLRCHAHGILWFSSKYANSNIEKMLSEAWSIGRKGKANTYNEPIGYIDCSNVRSSAAEYVARYVNGFSNLPKLYQYKTFRPFSLQSRHPAIGTLPYKDEVLQKLVDSEACEIRIFDTNDNKYHFVPLWRSIEDRLYPKFPQFSTLSDVDRVSIFDFFFSSNCEDYGSFKTYVQNFCLVSKDVQMIAYLRSIVEYSTVTLSGLYHLYLACQRIIHNAQTFGFSAFQYIHKISRYYENKQKKSLTNYFQFKVDYVRDHPNQIKHLLMMDELFYKSLSVYSNIPTIENINQKEFNILDFYDCLEEDFDESPKSIQDYKDNLFLNNKIQRDSSKTKQKNEYLNKVRYNPYYSWIFKVKANE